MNVIKPFGFALIATFFIIHMIDAASKDQLTIDTIIKAMIQLTAVVAIAGNIDMIINTMLSIGESIVASLDDLYKSPNSTMPTAEDIIEQAKDSGEGAISFFAMAVVCWLVHQIAIIAIDVAAISRAIEVGWRCAFAPIGIANSFDGGANSAGVRYLKSLGAAILCGGVLWAIMAIGFAISAGFLTSTDDIGKLFVAVAATFATAGAAIAASSKVKEIVG